MLISLNILYIYIEVLISEKNSYTDKEIKHIIETKSGQRNKK